MLFKWKDSYSCNVAEIDAQHQKLFQLGSQLYSIMSLADELDHYDEIMEILEELKDYTLYHFRYEEELMKRYGYEELDQHVQEHNAFVGKIIKVSERDVDENQSKVTMDILMFIANWIENHILKSDLRYKDFLNSNGVY